MNSTYIDAWLKWINEQNVTDWRQVVFKYPSLKDTRAWHEILRKTFREIDQTIIKGSIKKLNQAINPNRARRLVLIGGDIKANVAYHSHCIVDGLGINQEKFSQLIQDIWIKNVRKHLIREGIPFYEKEATVYSTTITESPREYLLYAIRREGAELGTNTDKICEFASYLDPSSNSKSLELSTIPLVLNTISNSK